MRLRLADPALLKSNIAEVSRIGDAVNDPELYQRIQDACHKKQAFLFVSPDGFIVLKPIAGPSVLIWVAFSNTAADWTLYLGEIEKLAREIRAENLVFWSNRKGFHKSAGKYGFTSSPNEWMGRPITVWSKKLTIE